MKTVIKKIFVFIFIILSLFFILFIYDMMDYDRSYVNRSSFVFDVKNLNSRHSHRIIFFLRKNYINFTTKISNKHIKRWNIEEKSERLKYPDFKIIPKKTSNFTLSSDNNEIYKNHSNWLKSHGNNYSNRFSALKQINKENIKDLGLVWAYKSNDSIGKDVQANPVVIDGFIYTSTPGNNVVCIDGKNGKEVWRFKVEEGIAARRGFLIWKKNPNKIPIIFFTNNRDKLFALNAKTGEKFKSFGNDGEIKIGVSPIPPLIIDNFLIATSLKPDLQVYDVNNGKLLWKYYLKVPKNSFLFENFLRGNPWGGISADDTRGIVYITTGNPAPDYIGVDRPGDNLFANSIIAIDIKNKKKIWHFQEISHDIWNLDIAAPPILTKIKRGNIDVDVVVTVTKLGNTIILDRVTGEPIFDFVKKRAPTSKIPGERTAIYQPEIKIPEPICRNIFKKEYITNINKKNHDYISSIVDKANYGFPAPYEIERKNIAISSCVRWAGASVDSDKNRMYVSADNIPGLIEIKKSKIGKFNYYHTGKPLLDLDGYPGIKPPWGTLTSMNLNNGKILWQVPLGEYESLSKKGIPITGTANRAGATATAGELIFVSGTHDKKIRAFDTENGEELWSYQLSSLGSAPPTSYMIDNKQYVIISAFDKGGDELLAFSIK